MKEVKMTAQTGINDIEFDGAFDNCHIGCGSCDLYATTHTDYDNGMCIGVVVKVSCGNAEQCRHLLEHLEGLFREKVTKQISGDI